MCTFRVNEYRFTDCFFPTVPFSFLSNNSRIEPSGFSPLAGIVREANARNSMNPSPAQSYASGCETPVAMPMCGEPISW
jgi:hypothetical protein